MLTCVYHHNNIHTKSESQISLPLKPKVQSDTESLISSFPWFIKPQNHIYGSVLIRLLTGNSMKSITIFVMVGVSVINCKMKLSLGSSQYNKSEVINIDYLHMLSLKLPTNR